MNVGENSHPGILKIQKNPDWKKKKKKVSILKIERLSFCYPEEHANIDSWSTVSAH